MADGRGARPEDGLPRPGVRALVARQRRFNLLTAVAVPSSRDIARARAAALDRVAGNLANRTAALIASASGCRVETGASVTPRRASWRAQKTGPRERQHHRRHAGAARRMRRTAAAVVHRQRRARQQPAMRRIADHQAILRQAHIRQARPARVKQYALPSRPANTARSKASRSKPVMLPNPT